MSEIALRLQSVVKRFGAATAVSDLSLDVRRGDFVSLLGPSGCGKTTASRCILRAIDPTGGEIAYRARDGRTVDLASLTPAELRPLRAEGVRDWVCDACKQVYDDDLVTEWRKNLKDRFGNRIVPQPNHKQGTLL